MAHCSLPALLHFPGIPSAAGQPMRLERLWQELFSDPSQWWDNRSRKKNPNEPDFKHKYTKEALWINNWLTPPWVTAELAAVTQGRRQYGVRTRARDVFVHSRNAATPGKEQDKEVVTLCKEGRLKEALDILDVMDQQGIRASFYIYGHLLQGCINMKALAEGKRLHAHITRNRVEQNASVGSTLIRMYAKCGSLMDARKAFDNMTNPNLVSWNAVIAGYTSHGCSEEAFSLFQEMQRKEVKPNKVTFTSILKACASLKALKEGKRIHADIIKTGIEPDVFLETAIVDMYIKCGCIENARQVFDRMLIRNVVSWTTMIAGYAQHGHFEEASNLFQKMQQDGIKPNVVSWTAIIAGYAQCGNCEGALKFFWQMQQEGIKPSVVSWNTILAGHTQHGHVEKAHRLFQQMQQQGVKPDVVSWTTLISGYAQCGHSDKAFGLFEQMQREGMKPTVVSWNAMIAGYAQNGCREKAFHLFQQMKREGVRPDACSWTTIISAFAQHGDYEKALELLHKMRQEGTKPDVVTWTAVITGYTQNGHIDNALKLYWEMRREGIRPNVVSWNALIAGYAQHGHSKEALELYWKMQEEDVKPNNVTFVSILNACSTVAALEQGKLVHAEIIKTGFEADIYVLTSLVDMYAKCGSIEDARDVFDKAPKQDIVLWNTMITGYAMYGHGEEAIQLFDDMQQEGLKPDHITFIGLLSACTHGCLLEEGRHFFDSISRDYGFVPTKEHCSCMIDLLGRAGCLDEAADIITKLPFQPDAVLWLTLLGACKTHGYVKLAELAAECALKLKPEDSAPYVLLSNIYVAAGRWNDRRKVRKTMENWAVETEQEQT